MSEYKYYAVSYPTGSVREIYKSVSTSPSDFGLHGLWRAKKDGTWSDSHTDVEPLLNDFMRGDFDLVDDEITEDQANAYLSQWRSSGSWPGRE